MYTYYSIYTMCSINKVILINYRKHNICTPIYVITYYIYQGSVKGVNMYPRLRNRRNRGPQLCVRSSFLLLIYKI